MEPESKNWSKEELKVYILLLCAKADKVQSEEEIQLIKNKTSAEIFRKMQNEFNNDNEDESLVKIKDVLERYEYSNMELTALRNEIQQVFSSDDNVNMKERNLGWVLDNILY